MGALDTRGPRRLAGEGWLHTGPCTPAAPRVTCRLMRARCPTHHGPCIRYRTARPFVRSLSPVGAVRHVDRLLPPAAQRLMQPHDRLQPRELHLHQLILGRE